MVIVIVRKHLKKVSMIAEWNKFLLIIKDIMMKYKTEHLMHLLSGIKNEKVVGIITESDILRAFIDMMGLLSASSRIDVVVGDQPSALKKALQIIHDTGGEIINVGQTRIPGTGLDCQCGRKSAGLVS